MFQLTVVGLFLAGFIVVVENGIDVAGARLGGLVVVLKMGPMVGFGLLTGLLKRKKLKN